MKRSKTEYYLREIGFILKETEGEELNRIEKIFRKEHSPLMADYVHEINSGLEIEEVVNRFFLRSEGKEIPLYHGEDSSWLQRFFQDLEKLGDNNS